MKPPRLVKIGPYVYQVKLLSIQSETGVTGLHGGDVLEVLVDTAQAPGAMRDTVWHELGGHAALSRLGIRGTDPGSPLQSSDDEERLVRGLCTEQLDILRRNPSLRRYLFEEDR